MILRPVRRRRDEPEVARLSRAERGQASRFADADLGEGRLRDPGDARAGAAGELVKGEGIATAQPIPQKFLESILLDLRHAELVASRRGLEGGYTLGRPADEISIADVIRGVEGPIATVRGVRPDDVAYHGPATALGPLWIELRRAMRAVLEETTLADIVCALGRKREKARRARHASPPRRA